MERGTPLSHYQLPKSNSESNLDQNSNSNSTVTSSVVVTGVADKSKKIVVQQQQCMAREPDQYMPIANVIRIMRQTLPSHAKISDNAKEMVQECVSEYISFVTGEANERCQREQRKTITAEDILWAMSKLGFDEYVQPLTLFINRYRELESVRGSLLRGEPSPYTHALGGSAIGFHGPPLPLGPYGYGMLDQSMVLGGGRYYHNGSGQDESGFGSGASSPSMNGMPAFDQYAVVQLFAANQNKPADI